MCLDCDFNTEAKQTQKQQLKGATHSAKPEIRFCAVSYPASGVSEICNDENIPFGNKAYHLSSVNHSAKTIHQFDSSAR